jgi:hypothetical protein
MIGGKIRMLSLLTLLVFASSQQLFSSAKVYPGPSGITQSDLYTAKVDGQSLFMYPVKIQIDPSITHLITNIQTIP